MKKEIKLFLDMEFTSLSPDAQPISLGIVSEEMETNVPVDEIREFDNGSLKLKNHKLLVDNGFGMKESISKSFYAEFDDFDINRCDDWVKENVVSKLKYLKFNFQFDSQFGTIYTEIDGGHGVLSRTGGVKLQLKNWLSQFSDYQIQIVVDCGTWDWYHFLQLVGEWEVKKYCAIKNIGLCQVKLGKIEKCPSRNLFPTRWNDKSEFKCQAMFDMRFGLPKLPSNISPVPQDLNDLIAFKQGISVREAFDLNREELAFDVGLKIDKHNALFDAKIIKSIYEKL